MTNPHHQQDPNWGYAPGTPPPAPPDQTTYRGAVYGPTVPQAVPPPQTPAHYLPQPMYPPQQPPGPGYVHTQSKTSLPTWMIVFYTLGGFPTCGLLWIAGLIHWWVVQSKSSTNTTIQPPL